MTWLETLEQTLKQSELKDILRDSLGPLYGPFHKLCSILWSIVLPGRTTEIYWLYLLSALAVGLGVYVWQHSKTRGLLDYVWQHSKTRGLVFNKLREFGLPRSIYAHKSAIVDYKYYFTFLILRGYLAFGTLVISTALIGGYCKSLLQHIFGPVESQLEAGLSARLIYTVLLVLAVDLGYFIAHYLEHKVPFFWEFHKVHHSAEVLTPITNYRLHPMDDFLQGFFMNLFGGTVSGIFGYLFYNGLDKITILNVSVIMLAHYLTANLRHSHIWLSYGWALSHVFYSPAMHQIHHSVVERHVDKNFGLVFSFCDYLAGTLYVPREQEDLKWGLKNQEHTEYSGVSTLLVLPVKKAARLVLSVILPPPKTRAT